MGVIIKNDKLKNRLLFIFDLIMLITWIIFIIMVHNFQQNCCEVYDKVCPKPNDKICYCINVSDLNEEHKPIPIPINTTPTILIPNG